MPASRNYILDKGMAATGALTKFRAVKLSTVAVQTVAPIAAAADNPFGITQEGLTTAEQARNFGVPVALFGTGAISEWEAGTTCAIGDQLVLDSVGRCVPVGTAAAGTKVVAVAMTAATVGLRLTAQFT